MKKVTIFSAALILFLAGTLFSQTITTNDFSVNTYCTGSNVVVSYTIDIPFNIDNIFSVELSDMNGDFSNPVIIGSSADSLGGSISGLIPLETASGTGYRIRVSGSDPAVTGSDNGSDLTFNASPNPVISGMNIICINASADYSTALNETSTYQWTVTGGIINGSSTDNSVNITWNESGAGNVSVVETNESGCQNTYSMITNVTPYPDAVISGDLIVCTNSDYSYSTTGADGTSNLWTISNGIINGTDTENSISVTWTDAGQGYLTLTLTSASGCVFQTIDTIQIFDKPTAIISGTTNICAGTSTTYSTTTPTDCGSHWTVTGGSITENISQDSIVVTWNESGSGSLTLEQVSNSGCVASNTLNVQFFFKPEAIITGTQNVCLNQTMTYTADTTDGLINDWLVPDGNVISQDNKSVTVLWDVAGYKNVLVTQTNSMGCVNSNSLMIDVNDIQPVTITGNADVCSNSIQTYKTPLNDGYTYLWSVTGGKITSNSNTESIEVLWGDAGAGTVNLVQTNDGGCVQNKSYDVNIEVLPAVVVNGPKNVCEKTIADYSVTTNDNLSYNWVVSGGVVTSQTTNDKIQVAWNNSGKGQVTLTSTNLSGCVQTISNDVTVNSNPKAVIYGSDTVNATSLVTYNTDFDQNLQYNWKITGGIIQDQNYGSSINVLWGSGSVGTIELVEISNSDCTDTTSKSVTIKSIADVNDNQPSDAFSIFPNPADDYINISMNNPQTNTIIKIYDIMGNLIVNGSVNSSNSISLNVTDFLTGVYFVHLYNNDSLVQTKMFVKK